MLSKPIKCLSMLFCRPQKWRLSFAALVWGCFWLALVWSRLHCLFQVVPHFRSNGKFTINQLHVRFYYKVRPPLLQCGTICITKWGNNYKVEQDSAQYEVELSNKWQRRIQMNLLKLIIVTTSFTHCKLQTSFRSYGCIHNS